jgi:hypothetical protein
MTQVSTFRLYLLRGVYLLIGIGLITMNLWPTLQSGLSGMRLTAGTVNAMLWALALLSFIGVRYPLQMLPLLFFEATWKTIWLLAVALPRWLSGTLTDGYAESAFACGLGVIVFIAIPWRYVFENYVRKTGDAWWSAMRGAR